METKTEKTSTERKIKPASQPNAQPTSEKARAWHFDPEMKQTASLQKGKDYVLMPATSKDIEKVLSFYQHHPVSGYDVSKVEVIYNPGFNRGFELHLRKLQKRDNNPAFVPKWSAMSNAHLRQSTYEQFIDLTQPHTDPDYPAVKLLPAWHGTKPEVLDSLFSAGYANLATTDNGFFGKGYYSAYEAEYSYRVYSKGALILNWVASFSPLPVVGNDMDALELEGKSNYGNYDAHFVPVTPQNPHDPHETVYYPCKFSGEQKYTEMVVFDSAALLPRYLVELQAGLLKSPADKSLQMAGSEPTQPSRFDNPPLPEKPSNKKNEPTVKPTTPQAQPKKTLNLTEDRSKSVPKRAKKTKSEVAAKKKIRQQANTSYKKKDTIVTQASIKAQNRDLNADEMTKIHDLARQAIEKTDKVSVEEDIILKKGAVLEEGDTIVSAVMLDFSSTPSHKLAASVPATTHQSTLSTPTPAVFYDVNREIDSFSKRIFDQIDKQWRIKCPADKDKLKSKKADILDQMKKKFIHPDKPELQALFVAHCRGQKPDVLNQYAAAIATEIVESCDTLEEFRILGRKMGDGFHNVQIKEPSAQVATLTKANV